MDGEVPPITIFSLVSLLSAAIYATLAVVVIRRSPRAGLNWFCGLILISYTVWALGNVFHHLQPLVTYEQAHLAHRFGMIGVYSYGASWVLFTLALTNRQKYVRSWLTYVPTVGIPLTLILNEWLGSGAGPLATHGSQYWGVMWKTNSPWYLLFTGYQGAAMLLGLYLVARFGRRATFTRQRRQASITFWTALVTWVVGSGIDIFYVNATHQPATEIAGSMLCLIWAVGLAVTMTRYGLTTFTVQAAADKILATVPDVLILLDTEGKILTANEATAEILGLSPKELAGLPASRLFEQPGDFQPLFSRLEREHHLPGLESTVSGRDRKVPVSITARTMPQADGTVRGSVWVLHDITPIRQAEELQAQMTREVASANKELNDFAHVVSHDLKAPLRAIDTLANWLGESCVDRLNAEEKEQFDLLQARVKRMHNLIEGVLQYSRAGRVREKQVEVNLSEMLPEVIDLLSPPAHIRVQIETPLPTVLAERTRIEQVFQNLLSNAIKYNDKPEGLIRLGGADDGEHWRFYVADNGPGIEEKDFERIFQVFQTGKPRDQVDSTGVGLAVVKRSVEMYGGRVWVDSRVGEGSTFFFTYPKQMPDPKQ